MIKNILRWVFGVSFLISGLSLIFQGKFSGLLSIALSLFLMPPTFKMIEDRSGHMFTKNQKWGISIFGLIWIMIVTDFDSDDTDNKYSTNDHSQFVAESDSILNQANLLLNKGDTASVSQLLAFAKKNFATPSVIEMENSYNKSKSMEFVENTLADMSEVEFKQLESGKLNKVYFNQPTLNSNFIALMGKNLGLRKEMLEMRRETFVRDSLDEVEMVAAKAADLRRESINKQFSAYDGSHRKLERSIKKNMHDPDSYDHVETRYADRGDHIFIKTKFRGTNAFGGKVLNVVIAKVDFDGNVLEAEYEPMY